MNKLTRDILIVVGIILVLGIIFAALIFYNNSTPNNNNDDNIVFYERGEIQTINISNESGEFTLKYDYDAKKWFITQYPFLELSENELSSTTYALTKIQYISEITKDISDLDKYGLKTPKSVVTVTTKDKTTKLLLGNITEDNNYYYFMIDGQKVIYTISASTGNHFLLKINDFRKRAFLTSELAGEVDNFVITKKNGEKIAVQKNSGEDKSMSMMSLIMTSPYKAEIKADALNNIISKFAPIESIDFVEDDNSKNSEYGFNDPDFKISFKVGENDYSVSLVKGPGGKILAISSEQKGIFVVSDDLYKALESFDPYEAITKYVNFVNLNLVKELKIMGDSKTFILNSNADEKKYWIGGKEALPLRFKETYQSIISISFVNKIPSLISNKVLYNFSFTLTDGQVLSYDYYDYDDRNLAIKRSDMIALVPKEKMTKLFAQLERFENDPMTE